MYKIKYQEKGKLKVKTINDNELEVYKNEKNIISVEKQTKISSKILNYSPFKKSIKNIVDEITLLLESNIKFDEAIELLLNNTKKEFDRDILEKLNISIKKGENISKSLEDKESEIGKMNIIFFQIISNSNDLKKSFRSFSNYLNNLDDIKQKIIKTLKYPLFLTLFFIITMIMIFEMIVPQFKDLFVSMDIQISFLTSSLFLLAKNYIYIFIAFILLVLVSFFSIRYFIKEKFVFFLDSLIFKYSKISKFYNSYLLFLQLRLLIENNYTLSESLNITKDILGNKYVNKKISFIIESINNGKNIYTAFLEANLFNEIVLRQIYVIEHTNFTLVQIQNIENYYFKFLNKQIQKDIAYIEPIFFILIAAFILWIITALFIPLWDITPR